ncbi:LysR family transcriptional regulator [Thalassotalea euphylliae]|uniref:LysR family transcriptional regulator n=1 Tax=Thalassotalea euphylliae TaxID=1655234 RepID=A0A3E0TLP1_9GAMM|nr:LysR family transcriptional regulator [Thalassotalea euphylliae]REL25479.1 LysR family transcriptional regulator [Thalassotalea euphylliae]
MINLIWLKTFCTLAEIGHFTQTAEQLFMTQSGVSQHIKKLEQSLNTALLIRAGKRFYLTQHGEQLYQQGLQLLSDASALSTNFSEDSQYQGQVSLMSPGSLGLKLYPYLLSIQQTYPELSIDYQFSSNRGIEQALSEHQLDIGLMTALPVNGEIIAQPLTQEPIVLVTPSHIEHPNWQTLQTLGFIDHPDAHHHAQLLLPSNYAQFEHLSQFKVHGKSNQISLILTPVALGLGFTVLPLHAASAFTEQSKIRIHHLAKGVSEPVYVCHHRRAQQPRRVNYIKQRIDGYLNNKLGD